MRYSKEQKKLANSYSKIYLDNLYNKTLVKFKECGSVNDKVGMKLHMKNLQLYAGALGYKKCLISKDFKKMRRKYGRF